MRAFPFVNRFWRPIRRSHCAYLLLMAVLLTTACAPSLTSTPSSSSRQLPAGVWEPVTLPARPSDIQSIAVSPADPSTMLACTTHRPISAQGTWTPGVVLWRTTDAGAHWKLYPSVPGSGTECHFSIAPDDPRRVAFQVTRAVRGTSPCADDTVLLSDDGGANWRQLPAHASIAPSDVVSGWCDLYATRQHLFLVYNFLPSSPSPVVHQMSLLERSDDNGVTWTRADNGLGDSALFTMPEIGRGASLAMTVVHMSAQPLAPATTDLWTSDDAGGTWRQTSALPEGAGTFLLTSPPMTDHAWPSPDRPFYALEQEQIPSDLYRERVLMSGDARAWTLLPPLPVPGASAERPGILQALAVLPDGRLAVWGPDPHLGVPASTAIQEPVTAFWLWFWDPVAARWQMLPSPLDASAPEGCGLCWQAQTAVTRDGVVVLYASYLDITALTNTPPGAFRVALPRAG